MYGNLIPCSDLAVKKFKSRRDTAKVGTQARAGKVAILGKHKRPNTKKTMYMCGTLSRRWLCYLTLCSLQSRLQHIYHGHPMAESTLTLGRSRLYPPSQGLWIWPQQWKKVTAMAGTPAIAVLKGVKERFPHKKQRLFSFFYLRCFVKVIIVFSIDIYHSHKPWRKGWRH